MLNLLDKIGDWNPQLFREIKGRLKIFNVTIIAGISLLSQLALFFYQPLEIPGKQYSLVGKHCNLKNIYKNKLDQLNSALNLLYQKPISQPVNSTKITQFDAQVDAANNKISEFKKFLSNNYCPPDQVNMQQWWLDHWKYIFVYMSVAFVFILLVGGTYLIINNLYQEEHRGTLSFLRLSPQTESDILIGKILGVPILIYLLIFLTVPFHIFCALSANIPFSKIISFYVVLVASCFLFFSGALLFALVCRWLCGFQPWLGSGTVLVFLMLTPLLILGGSNGITNVFGWLVILNPLSLIYYLFPGVLSEYIISFMGDLNLFNLPIGKSLITLVSFQVLQFCVWGYWIWVALKRSFHNQNITIISKIQSYCFIAFFQVVLWGYTLQYKSKGNYHDKYYDVNYQIGKNLYLIIFFNLLFLFGLIVILSQNRQTVQDWARYRHQSNCASQNTRNKSFKSFLIELILGEKSPAILAIAINLIIAVTPVVIWIKLVPFFNLNKNDSINWLNEISWNTGLLAIIMFISLMLIYATVAQMVLLMKKSRSNLWAIGIVTSIVVLPAIVLSLLGISSGENFLWMLISFPFYSLGKTSQPTMTMLLALFGQLITLAFLNFQLRRTIKLLGASATTNMNETITVNR
ncbi:MAG: ABC transporter permease [Scytonematopsis contorta HA4267-MV1]|jgi:hypothetical protein|nr:ABC transporter permease [Scytonematopsis contorta HA4267-MV1]